MFSMPVALKSKNSMVDMFETIAHFPNLIVMVKSGDNEVDAHSLMGFFSIDPATPFELLFESEPDIEFKKAISKFELTHAI